MSDIKCLKSLYGDELIGQYVAGDSSNVIFSNVYKITGKCDGIIILSDWLAAADTYQEFSFDRKIFIEFNPSEAAKNAYGMLLLRERTSEN